MLWLCFSIYQEEDVRLGGPEEFRHRAKDHDHITDAEDIIKATMQAAFCREVQKNCDKWGLPPLPVQLVIKKLMRLTCC